MSEFAFFTPSFGHRIKKSVVSTEKQGFQLPDDSLGSHQGVVQMRNATGGTIPPFALLQIKQRLEMGYVEVVKPKNASFNTLEAFLVNGWREIPTNEFGSSQSGPLYLVRSTETYSVGTRLGWSNGTFDAGLGSLLMLIGYHDTFEDVACCIANNSCLYGTATSEITSTTPGTVDVDGVVYTATTKGASIASSSSVVLWPYKGTWLALRVC